MEMKILDLPLKKEWYDMIESGIKTEEYREIKPYWYQRLYQRKKEFGYDGRLTREECEYICQQSLRYILKGEGFAVAELKPFTHIRFRYGYTKRTMLFELNGITIGKGNTEWGAPADKEVFILKLGKKVNFYFDMTPYLNKDNEDDN